MYRMLSHSLDLYTSSKKQYILMKKHLNLVKHN